MMNKILNLKIKNLFLLLLVVLLLIDIVNAIDVFDSYDVDKSNSLSRNEFFNYVDTIKIKINPMLDVAADGDAIKSSNSFNIFNYFTFPSMSSSSSDNNSNNESTLTSSDTANAGFISGTINSLILILVTEIGDKTFFIASKRAKFHVCF